MQAYWHIKPFKQTVNCKMYKHWFEDKYVH